MIRKYLFLFFNSFAYLLIRAKRQILFLMLALSFVTFMGGWNDSKMYGFDWFNLSLMSLTPIMTVIMSLLVLKDIDDRSNDE